MALPLSKQALILIAVPLVFELGLGGLIQFLLSEMDREQAEMVTSMRVGTLTRTMTAYGVERVLLLGMSKVSDSPALELRAKLCALRASKALDELIELMDTHMQKSAAWEEIKDLGHSVDLENSKAEKLKKVDQMAASMQWLKVCGMMDKLFKLCDQLAVEQLQKQKTIRHEILQHQQQIRLSLTGMLLFSLVLVVAIAASFGAQTRRRILVLADNTNRLAAGKPLHEPLTGNDDLVTLDKTFRRLHDELAIMRRKERALLENAAEVIASLDSSGLISSINAAAKVLWGYSEDELLGTALASLLGDSDKAALESQLKRIKESNHKSSFDCGVRTKQGQIAFCAFSVTWSLEEESYYLVIHDVTAKKEVEQLKADFVNMVSHDLRAPLTSVIMTNEMIENGNYGELNASGLQAMARSQSSIKRVISLVNGLLDLEKIEAGKMELVLEWCNINELAEASLDAVSALAEQKQLKTEIEIDGELKAYADRERVIQVLVNLLSNAIKFSNPGGGTVRITATSKEENLFVNVIDQGRGIPSNKLADLFDRFKQVKQEDSRKKGGTGLGLAICKSIVELHGGRLGVESKEGEGSTFWFTLPINMQEY